MMNHSEPEVSKDMAERLTQDSAAFDAAIVHFCRGEIQRLTVWRQRLDVTSNWSILLMVALITFTLGSPDVPHFTLLLGLALIAISVLILLIGNLTVILLEGLVVTVQTTRLILFEFFDSSKSIETAEIVNFSFNMFCLCTLEFFQALNI